MRVALFWNVKSRPVAERHAGDHPSLITRQRQSLGSTVSRGEFRSQRSVGFSIQLRRISIYFRHTGRVYCRSSSFWFESGDGLNVPQIPAQPVRFSGTLFAAFQFLVSGDGSVGISSTTESPLATTLFHPRRLHVATLRHRWTCLSRWKIDQRSTASGTAVPTVGPPSCRAGLRLRFGSR
jgi:hypothetical protein